MSGAPVWERPLASLDRAEWESLCDGCGKCCLHKIEDELSGEIHPTNVACRLLDRSTALCSDYKNRRTFVPDCVRLSAANVARLAWLPSTCAYRLRSENKPLPEWHPLLTGDPDSTHKAGMSVRGWTVSEDEAGDLEHHLVDPNSSELRLPSGTPLTLKVSPRAKVMRLRVDQRTGTVLLTIPRRVSQRRALDWAAGQGQWIEDALAAVAPTVAIGPGTTLPVEGEPHVVDWDSSRPRRIEIRDGRLLAGGPEEGLEARILRWLKDRARDVLSEETAFYAARAGRKAVRVSVGDPLSRWGSCSSSGAIRYSWRLILAPPFVRRATVAHEVAHLVHMNHAPAFHALVAEIFGEDPRPARLWLRREGASLHRIGRA